MTNIVYLNDRASPVARQALLDALPAAGTTRWVARRKAAVVAAVEAGVIAAEDVRERYRISEEELACWRASVADHGVDALRVTRMQHYRNT